MSQQTTADILREKAKRQHAERFAEAIRIGEIKIQSKEERERIEKEIIDKWECSNIQPHTSKPKVESTTYTEERTLDGTLYRQVWTLDGQQHRLDGPAIILYHPNGVVHKEYWYKNGQLHREDGPAVIETNIHNFRHVSEWYYENKVHRLDGPAVTIREGNTIIEEEYCVDGKRHRLDGPALIHRHLSGDPRHEHWYKDGKEHRDGNLPSRIHWCSVTGVPYLIEYRVNGKLHRTDGPAYLKNIDLGVDGVDGEFEYYVNGNKVTDRVLEMGIEDGTPEFIFTMEML